MKKFTGWGKTIWWNLIYRHHFFPYEDVFIDRIWLIKKGQRSLCEQSHELDSTILKSVKLWIQFTSNSNMHLLWVPTILVTLVDLPHNMPESFGILYLHLISLIILRFSFLYLVYRSCGGRLLSVPWQWPRLNPRHSQHFFILPVQIWKSAQSHKNGSS